MYNLKSYAHIRCFQTHSCVSALAKSSPWNPRIVRFYLKTCVIEEVLEMELNSMLFFLRDLSGPLLCLNIQYVSPIEEDPTRASHPWLTECREQQVFSEKRVEKCCADVTYAATQSLAEGPAHAHAKSE